MSLVLDLYRSSDPPLIHYPTPDKIKEQHKVLETTYTISRQYLYQAEPLGAIKFNYKDN